MTIKHILLTIGFLCFIYIILLTFIGFYIEKSLQEAHYKNYVGLPINTQQAAQRIRNVGVAPYAIRNRTFPCKKFFRGLRGVKKLHISWLHDSFGNKNTCLKRVLADKRLKTVHIHLLNQVCVRNRNCEWYEVLSGYTISTLESGLINYDTALYNKIGKFASKLQALLDESLQPQTRCIIDPLLEANVNDLAATRLIKYLKRNYFPNCEFSWTSKSNLPKRATIRETHGSKGYIPAPCIRNLDGEDVSFPWQKCRFKNKYTCIKYENLPKYIENHQHCEATFLWSAEMNCVTTMSRISPRDRICSDTGAFKAFGDMIKYMQQ